jgi:hypothetical protein
MADLRVPEPDSPFRAYYRELIAESVRRSAEGSGKPNLRSSVRRSANESGEPHLRSSVRMVWIAAALLLAVDLLAFGVHSWTTSAADIGLIVLTLVWFWVCVDDLISPRDRTPGE